LNKYGIKEVRRRQSLGGLRGAKTKDKIERRKFFVDIKNPLFLEFYGALLGDGWMGNLKNKNKWLIGLCGHLKLDRDLIIYHRQNISDLFNRQGFLVERFDRNTLEFIFRHKFLFQFMNEKLYFPIGKKKDLKINKNIYDLGFSGTKYVIRGLFDTDGSFFLDKSGSGNSVPCISIHMNSPILIRQIGRILIDNGFKAHYSDHGKMIRLKGRKQLTKWMREIGSSNSKHLDKIARVAQPG
jgi:hypothetical protein